MNISESKQKVGIRYLSAKFNSFDDAKRLIAISKGKYKLHEYKRMNFTVWQHRYISGILNFLTKNNYSLEYIELQNNKELFSSCGLQRINGKYNRSERQNILKAEKQLEERLFDFVYGFPNKHHGQGKYNVIYFRAPIIRIIKNYEDISESELKQFPEIVHSLEGKMKKKIIIVASVITDMAKDYNRKLPYDLYSEIKSVTKRVSIFHIRFIEYLHTHKKYWTKLSPSRERVIKNALMCEYLLRKGMKNLASERTIECYGIAKKLGYIQRCVLGDEENGLDKCKDILYLNKEKFYHLRNAKT